MDQPNEKVLANILAMDYGINVQPESIARLKEKTASSAVFFVQSADVEYIVKISSWYSDAQASKALEKAYKISEALRLRGARLPEVMRNMRNNFITPTDYGHLNVSQFIDGCKFTLLDDEFAAIGRSMGEFHKAGLSYLNEIPEEFDVISRSIPVEKPYEESRELYRSGLRDKLLSDHFCSHPEVCGYIKEEIATLDAVIESINHSGINETRRVGGILHNDLNRKNIIFDEEGGVRAFIDQDQMGVGPLVWDLGNTLASFAWEFVKVGTLGSFEKKVGFFLKAYHMANPLPQHEYLQILAATQRWDMLRILRSMRRHHYENDRLPELLPKIKDRLIPRIKAAPEFFSFIKGKWVNDCLKDNKD